MISRVEDKPVNSQQKKHGWVYRGSLWFITSLAFLLHAAWLVSLVTNTIFYYPGVVVGLSPGQLAIVFANADDPYKSFQSTFTLNLLNIQDVFGWFKFIDAGGVLVNVIPLWPFVVLLHTWPIYVLLRSDPFRKVPGICRACGYDLRGSTSSATCPECGKAIARSGRITAK